MEQGPQSIAKEPAVREAAAQAAAPLMRTEERKDNRRDRSDFLTGDEAVEEEGLLAPARKPAAPSSPPAGGRTAAGAGQAPIDPLKEVQTHVPGAAGGLRDADKEAMRRPAVPPPPEGAEPQPELLRPTPSRSSGTAWPSWPTAPAGASRTGFLPGAPGPSAHVIDASLPGETRQVMTQHVTPSWAAGFAPPPRGAATGGRPVTSHIPIYNPVLDSLYNRGGAKLEKIAPIKMSLTGAAGSLDNSGYMATFRTRPMVHLEPGVPQESAHEAARRQAPPPRPSNVSQEEPAVPRNTNQWVHDASDHHPLLGMMGGFAAKAPPRFSQTERPSTSQTRNESTGAHEEASGPVVTGVDSQKGRGGKGGGGSDHGGRRPPGQSGTGGQTAPAPGGTPAATRARVTALRLASDNESFRLSMTKLQGMASSQSHSQMHVAVRHAGHSIHTLLKKLYRDEELDELSDEQAVNGLGLILKMGGEFTYAHSARVLDLAMELADEVGITDRKTRKQIKYGALLKDIGEMGLLLEGASDQKLNKLGDFMSTQDMLRAGLLHDIGKVRIPPEILYKPGRLTEEEYNIIKMHPIYGEEIVYPIVSLRHLCPTIRGHHERWDGKGYPDGLKGEDIPLPARIIAVADVFDALAAERPYKQGMPVEKVRRILEEGRGTHFDPGLVDGFLRIIERRYPDLRTRRT
ncbi:MAG: HD domain-containing protein [Armatimonadetes bacterium]|nr:HD domain-containing protein [Armatimonadota bacterium]